LSGEVRVRIASQRRAVKGSGGSLCRHLAGQLARISQETSRARTTSKAFAMPPISTKAETAQRFDQPCAVPDSYLQITLAPNALANGQP
jgi:hypothetical protein